MNTITKPRQFSILHLDFFIELSYSYILMDFLQVYYLQNKLTLLSNSKTLLKTKRKATQVKKLKKVLQNEKWSNLHKIEQGVGSFTLLFLRWVLVITIMGYIYFQVVLAVAVLFLQLSMYVCAWKRSLRRFALALVFPFALLTELKRQLKTWVWIFCRKTFFVFHFLTIKIVFV